MRIRTAASPSPVAGPPHPAAPDACYPTLLPLSPSFHLCSANNASLSLAHLREIARANRTRHWPPHARLVHGSWIQRGGMLRVLPWTRYGGLAPRVLPLEGWDGTARDFSCFLYFARVSAASNVNLLARLGLGFRCFWIARRSN